MAERGGPTTQSGIFYQNSVAAMYLGRLCDPRQRPISERVTAVRVEAPTEVDDIVVRFADHHNDWVQAKESVKRSDEAWKKLWNDFFEQSTSPNFRAEDRLVLFVGTPSETLISLREMCERAAGAIDEIEWCNSLSDQMQSLCANIISVISTKHKGFTSAFKLLQSTRVRITDLETLERDMVPLWIPQSNVSDSTLYSLLRDSAGGQARNRKSFHAPLLVEALASKHGIHIKDASGSGLQKYRDAILRAHSVIGVPGTSLIGETKTTFIWPNLKEVESGAKSSGFEDEDPRWHHMHTPTSYDIREFPRLATKKLALIAGAGFGKSTLLSALVCKLSHSTWVPALIHLGALADNNKTIVGYLTDVINEQFGVSIRWDQMCDIGNAVLFLDGLDELASSDRPRVLTLLKEFSSLYPEVPWVLTVRDAGAISVPIQARYLQVEPLTQAQVSKFIGAYRPELEEQHVNRILSLVHSYNDLKLLTRIPLFLSLFLATFDPTHVAPKNRGELIERYLYILFNPEEHKVNQLPLGNTDALRDAAEYLAFIILERGKLGIPDREARQILADLHLPISTGDLLNDLRTIGLLRRTHGRADYAFPIVQEYLAACYLMSHLPDELESRFAQAVTRPWAQTLQFALEGISVADRVIANVLVQVDDAFSTKLRLIGRCIINGANVSLATRGEVGKRLIQIWNKGSFLTRMNTGRLIADGFLEPLPLEIVPILQEPWSLHIGGADMINKIKRNDITISVVNEVLKSESEFYAIGTLKPAIESIATEFLDLVLSVAEERLKSGTATEKWVESIAYLIGIPDRTVIREEFFENIAGNTKYPPLLRLAAFRATNEPLRDTSIDLLRRVILSADNRTNYGMNFIREYLQRAEIQDLWINLMIDPAVAEELKLELLFLPLSHTDYTNDAKKDWYRGIEQQRVLEERYTEIAHLLRAYLGDQSAMNEATEHLASLTPFGRDLWCKVIGGYTECDNAIRGLSIIRDMTLQEGERLRIASTLEVSLRGRIEIQGVHSFSWQPSASHPLSDGFATIIAEWSRDYAISDASRLRLMVSSIKLGDEDIEQPLKKLVEKLAYSSQVENLAQDYQLDNALAEAMSTLSEKGFKFERELMSRLAHLNKTSIASIAIEITASFGDEQALIALVNHYNREINGNERWRAHNIYDHLERLSLKLGCSISLEQGLMKVATR